MLTFLRKIRKSLVDSGATRKYILYAVGEIFLVMIGILLALQVNNWNEAQQSNIRQIKILHEFVKSIDEDLRLYERSFDWRLDLKKEGIDSFLYYVGTHQSISKEAFIRLFYKMQINPILRFDSGPFEALKSTGLDIIENDSLRTEINRTYQLKLPAEVGFATRIVDLNNQRIQELESEIMIRQLDTSEVDNWKLQFYPKTDDILSNQDVLEIVDLQAEKLSSISRRLQSMRENLISLKELIHEELNRRK